jgi:hypothetical protein
MAGRLVVAGVCAVAMVCSPASAAHARSRHRCRVGRGERVLLSNRTGIVTAREQLFGTEYEVRELRTSRLTYHACLRRAGRRVLLGHSEYVFHKRNDPYFQGFQLAGRYITFISGDDPAGAQRVAPSVQQYDLVSGRRTFAIGYSEAFRVPGYPAQTGYPPGATPPPELVANAAGDAAWLLSYDPYHPGGEASEPSSKVIVHDHRGFRTAAAYDHECVPGPFPMYLVYAPSCRAASKLRITATNVYWQQSVYGQPTVEETTPLH